MNRSTQPLATAGARPAGAPLSGLPGNGARDDRRGSAGFSLLEGLLVMALLALALALGGPALTRSLREAQLRTVARSLLAALQLARSEALSCACPVWVLPADGMQWSSGWAVQAQPWRPPGPSAAPLILLEHGPIPASLQLNANGTAQGPAPYVLFGASGGSRTRQGGISNLRFTLSQAWPAEPQPAVRQVVVLASGRLRLCRPPGGADSAC